MLQRVESGDENKRDVIGDSLMAEGERALLTK